MILTEVWRREEWEVLLAPNFYFELYERGIAISLPPICRSPALNLEVVLHYHTEELDDW